LSIFYFELLGAAFDSIPSMRWKRLGVGRLVALAVLACTMTVLIVPAQALGDGMPRWAVCANSTEAADLSTPHLAASPASGATVPTGTPVTLSVKAFSGEADYTLTFSVASSSALLSTPDIDSGPGSLQPGTSLYAFTSTKATATPRTIYWDASFTFTPEDCESPSMFTTPVRTLVVVPSEAELAAAKRQQQEAAVKNKQEEETATKKKQQEEALAGTGDVSKPKVKSLNRTQRLAAALEGCHQKGRKQRMVCERRARRAYGPLHSKQK
jgi:hypothetical protein